MNKILVYLCLAFMTSAVLANSIMLDNKTDYPEKAKQSKIAVQWADSAEAIQKANKIIINSSTLNLLSLNILPKKGQNQLTPPNHAQYFRVIVWSTNKQNPDLLTNWVNIIPNKIYVLSQDLLVPAILMSGTGC